MRCAHSPEGRGHLARLDFDWLRCHSAKKYQAAERVSSVKSAGGRWSYRSLSWLFVSVYVMELLSQLSFVVVVGVDLLGPRLGDRQTK
jgi:hypothetical protein